MAWQHRVLRLPTLGGRAAAAQISFQSEIVDVLRTKTDAVTAMTAMSAEMRAVRAEHDELQVGWGGVGCMP